MQKRCLNQKLPAWKDYGGRGITVCERWLTFENFYADMGPRPSPKYSLDRIDNNGSYSPENCRWATQSEQMNNQRGNRYLTFDGRTISATGWARETGIPAQTLYRRLRLGWTIERTLTEPINPVGGYRPKRSPLT